MEEERFIITFYSDQRNGKCYILGEDKEINDIVYNKGVKLDFSNLNKAEKLKLIDAQNKMFKIEQLLK